VDGALQHNYVCLVKPTKQDLSLESVSRAGIKVLALVLLVQVSKIVDHVLFGHRTVFGVNHLMELEAVKTLDQLLDAQLSPLALARN